jgi:hypothetical protein
MRKFLVVLIAFVGICTAVFAETPKVALGLNLGPTMQTLLKRGGLGIGAVAEFDILENLSAAAMFSYATYRSTIAGDVSQISPCVQLRWYPITKAVAGFWLAPRYQYSIITANGTGTPVSRGLSIVVLNAGYKLFLEHGTGVYLEPYLGYGLIFDIEFAADWDYGISIGFAF